MSDSQRNIEALRALWPASERLSDSEVRSLADQIREKDRSIRASTQAGSRNGLIAALVTAIVTVAAASHARWVWAQVGYALCAAAYIAAVVVLMSYRRRDRATPALDLDIRAYYDELIGLHDREIRFLQTAKYWYLAPVLVGVALIGWGLWVQTANELVAVLVGVVVPLVSWVAVNHLTRRTITDLRAGRDQVARWLKEVGLD